MSPTPARNGVALALLTIALTGVGARDFYDIKGDSSCATSTAEMFHGTPPQVHDLEASGGVNDVDFIWTSTLPYRSYEFTITGPAVVDASLTLTDSAGTSLLDSVQLAGFSYSLGLAWAELAAAGGQRCARVDAPSALAATDQYTATFRETTLYCPRYNNTGTQTSVLIIQDSRFDTNLTCNFVASFRNEGGSILGTVQETLGVGATRVISLPTVTGLTGTKGAAQIAHSCGNGGLKAKLVALEPATGFAFDTPCSQREP